MTLCCPEPDFFYPMNADVYYPIITQNEYGQPNKQWVLDRTFICNATTAGSNSSEEIKPDMFLQYQDKLVARSKTDIRISSNNENNAITNILISNIRNANNELIYKETSGPRSGRGTIFEIAAIQPFLNPFGDIEYYRMVWRRTENQSVGD